MIIAAVQRGRLQTQHISAAALGHPAVYLQLSGVPEGRRVKLERPVTVRLQVVNSTQLRLGPLHVGLPEAKGVTRPFFVVGPLTTIFNDGIPPRSAASAALTLLPAVCGVQTLSGLTVSDDEGRIVATLQHASMFVSE